MTILLKQSTAVILKLGPFVDESDAVTPESGLTIAQGDIQLSKNGGAFAQTSASSPTTTYDADGFYPIPLTTTDTATLGTLVVQVTKSGALPVWVNCMVVPANVWDSLFGADLLQVDATQVEGGDASDVLDASAAVGAAVALASYDAPTKAELDSGLAGLNDPTAAAIADAVWEEDITDHDAVSDSTAEALSNAGAAGTPPTVEEIADQVWEEAIGDHSGTSGSTAEQLAAAGAAGDPWATALPGSYSAGQAGKIVGDNVNAPIGTVDTVVDAIKAKTDNLPSDPADESALEAAIAAAVGGLNDPTAAAVADAVWDEALSGHTTSGTAGKALGDLSVGSVAGPGATTWVVEIDDGVNPIQGAALWVATDAAGANVVAGPLVTDSFGDASFLLDAGTYYVWMRKDGYEPRLAVEMVVS
jgi:hypothetical protein